MASLRLVTVDRNQVIDNLRASQNTDFDRFLEHARQQTRRGDTIALVTPSREWDGVSYLRASYALAGREVLPTISPDNRKRPDNADRADVVLVWSRDGGRLLRRR